MATDVEIRDLAEEDEPQVLALLAASMGATADDSYRRFFRWKHRENPFGDSPGWVAEAGGEVVGLRVFLRWDFRDGAGVRRAVRAVDTATHPDHRGKGIFKRLTLHGLEQVAAEGVEFVFNTPNEQSRPGYLKMGWQQIGRLPVALHPRSPRAALRTIRSRTAAERASLRTEVGIPAPVPLADTDSIEVLLADQATHPGLSTRRDAAVLRWRYGAEQLQYRALLRTDRVEDGLLLFRLRRRGRATELVVDDVLAPWGAEQETARLATRALRATKADHTLALVTPGTIAARLAPPGLGPTLTWRPLADGLATPTLHDWSLAMGDVELF